ncbi:putative hydrocarbon binding protein (contains V4R domain) [Synechococcus sp. PCC 7502]|uniref:V4R domain-containing protein n=1 Tax=Synechococcus sp. PCC 7502 TaxID=1173263 RepID=UPI00029FEDF1|nr:V4R domain-containing protein [Synechococcus sp. PCC 7502]AFY72492.1 putative hydrocarbon binding protein (contains V4R domain) [Synechococcus sp. PCC 7502]
MISVADLIQENQVSGNYFGYETYVRGDLESGLLENRRGDRLIAVPTTLIKALYSGLEKETGQAAGLVLFNCGKWWGKNFYTRFNEEITDFYHAPLAEIDMGIFLAALKQCWTTHGWGQLEFDPTYQDRGFILIKTSRSAYSQQLSNQSRPSCFLEAGILTSFFSRLTGRELIAVQISCESMGADVNRFVLGISDRLHIVNSLIDQGLNHEAILSRLLEA